MVEHLGDDAVMMRCQVLDDEHRHREVGGQCSEHLAECQDPARGRGERHHGGSGFAGLSGGRR